MLAVLLASPDSAPKPILRFDLGCLTILETIHVKSLMFLHFLQSQNPQSLSHQIYLLQLKNNYPGLVTNCRQLIKMYQLPNIIDEPSLNFSKKKWKDVVTAAVRRKSESDFKNLILDYSKLRNKGLEDESLEIKSYITDLTLKDTRMKYRLRSFTLPLKMNMKLQPAFVAVSWRCDS